MRLAKSEIVHSMKLTTAGVSGLSALGYKAYNSYQLYVSTWDLHLMN